jgi:hypothetical protein
VRAFIDRVDVRPCRQCGQEVLRVPDQDDGWSGVVRLEVAPRLGADVVAQRGPHHLGWAHTGRFWRLHRFADHPLTYAFLEHSCSSAAPTKGKDRMTSNAPEPFGESEGRPSVSFKDAPIGTVVVCTVESAPKMVQARHFETGQPDFWPDGNPKQTAVVDVTVDGEERSLWAPKPSAMYKAITDAVKAAGQQLAPGGKLSIRFSGEKPNDNPRLNAQKLYQAHYEPPAVFVESNEWATPSAAPAPTPTSAPPVAESAPAASTPAPPWAS